MFFHPRGKTIVASTNNGVAAGTVAWDVDSKKELWRHDWAAQSDTRDGENLIGTGPPGKLRLRYPRTPNERDGIQLPGPGDYAGVTADGRHVVTHNNNGTVYVLRLAAE